MKGENSTTSSAVGLRFNWVRWLVRELLVFWSTGHRFWMDYDSEHKSDDSDNGWGLDSEHSK